MIVVLFYRYMYFMKNCSLQSLDSGDEHPKSVGTSSKYVLLNRFAKITVCKCLLASDDDDNFRINNYLDDHNRIILNPLDDCQGEFVNACYIEVCHY